MPFLGLGLGGVLLFFGVGVGCVFFGAFSLPFCAFLVPFFGSGAGRRAALFLEWALGARFFGVSKNAFLFILFLSFFPRLGFFGAFFGSGAGRRPALFLGGRFWVRCLFFFLLLFGAFLGSGAGWRAALFWVGFFPYLFLVVFSIVFLLSFWYCGRVLPKKYNWCDLRSTSMANYTSGISFRIGNRQLHL